MSEQGKRSMAGTVESPASSCVSSDAEDEAAAVVQAAKPMVVVGCPQCLMYVMLSGEEQQPKCPRCKSPVLLHFLRREDATSSNNNSKLLPAPACNKR